MSNNTGQLQRNICRQYGVSLYPSPFHLKVGIARNAHQGAFLINGLRHPPEGDTTGWYIWAGEEFSEAADFFEPLHVEHLVERCPEILPYLGLPPGWRFLIAPEYEDVWFDESLFNI
jgi:hypothetical protein